MRSVAVLTQLRAGLSRADIVGQEDLLWAVLNSTWVVATKVLPWEYLNTAHDVEHEEVLPYIVVVQEMLSSVQVLVQEKRMTCKLPERHLAGSEHDRNLELVGYE
jgi:hypothetical protein